MVKWTEKDDNKGWKPGWYTAIIKKYIKVSDVLEIECVSEPGKVYKVHVKDSMEKGTLRLHVTTCGVADLYDQVTEIGASTLIKWTKEEVTGSGWKAGWYEAEVQAFEPDTDEITIIYKREPTIVYTECHSIDIRGKSEENKMIKLFTYHAPDWANSLVVKLFTSITFVHQSQL